MITRREFLAAASGSIVIAAAEPGVRAEVPVVGRVVPDSTDWFDRPMRWAQLTLVETDPGR